MLVGFCIGERLVRLPSFPFMCQEVVNRIIHVFIVGWAVSFKNPVLSYGNGGGRIYRTLFRLYETESKSLEQVGAAPMANLGIKPVNAHPASPRG